MGEKIKSYIDGFFKKNKNKSGIFIILIIGIILLIAGSVFFGTPDETKKDNGADSGKYVENLEKKLSGTLDKIKGVSKASVMITLESENKVDVAQNQRTKRSSSNGTEDYEEEITTQLKRNSSGESEIVLNEYYPKIKGVVVVAGGVDDIEVKVNVYNAVKAVLGVNGNRIVVVSN